MLNRFIGYENNRTVTKINAGIGYDITKFSAYPTEAEVLLEGVTTIRITRVETFDEQHHLVQAGQIYKGLHECEFLYIIFEIAGGVLAAGTKLTDCSGNTTTDIVYTDAEAVSKKGMSVFCRGSYASGVVGVGFGLWWRNHSHKRWQLLALFWGRTNGASAMDSEIVAALTLVEALTDYIHSGKIFPKLIDRTKKPVQAALRFPGT